MGSPPSDEMEGPYSARLPSDTPGRNPGVRSPGGGLPITAIFIVRPGRTQEMIPQPADS